MKLHSATILDRWTGEEVVCGAGEEDRERGRLMLVEDLTLDAEEELDRGERSSGLAEGV